ncbi:MAG: hypothetical protein ACR2IK_05250 [Chloroflexota bacterium]
MTAATPAQRDLARWLLMQELRDSQEAEALPDAAERACQKLCRRVARLVTTAGCKALLARALHLATAEFPFLAGVEANPAPDTYLEGLPARAERVEPSTMRDALTLVLAGVIMLLATFIGEDLSMRLVRDVWPDAPIREEVSGTQEMQA